MLSWVDAASYTERALPGYEALIDLKALSWHYMNLCGMCSDPQHSAELLCLFSPTTGIKNCDMHSVQRVGCTRDSFPFYYLWITLHDAGP